MKKIVLKIIQKIAQKNNTDISEIFAVFMSIIATNGNIDDVLKKYNLNKKEEDILKEFFKYLKNDLIYEKEEFIKKFVDITDLEKSFKNLALFFTIFISYDILFSKDPQKIKESLKIYPEEIKETIIKSLEMLSLADTKIEKKFKINILKEILNTIIILTFIVRNLNV